MNQRTNGPSCGKTPSTSAQGDFFLCGVRAVEMQTDLPGFAIVCGKYLVERQGGGDLYLI